MDTKELWSKVVPFPPGWWEIHDALDAVQAKDLEKARQLANKAVFENDRWKADVKALGLSPWPWTYRTDPRDPEKVATTQVTIFSEWIHHLCDKAQESMYA